MFSSASNRVLLRTGVRYYLSRAHPRPIPEFPVLTAMDKVLDGIEERKAKRVARWARNAPARRAKGIEVRSQYCSFDGLTLRVFWITCGHFPSHVDDAESIVL
jgi:hypothetical protein